MEPVTHILTGACLSRAGLNRRTAYCTLTMAVAAEFPDIDTLWSLRGPVPGFEHHRGITHTFLSIPLEAALIVAFVWLIHRVRSSRRTGNQRSRSLSAIPVRWTWLSLCAVIGLLSHLLLDYATTYGIRPFLPFNPHWYAGPILFIFDPLFFAILLIFVVLLPPLFRLISSEVGSRSGFASAGWSLAALGLLTVYSLLRAANHIRAQELVQTETFAPAVIQQGSSRPGSQLVFPRAIEVGPDPFDPFLWHAVMDFGEAIQQADVHLHTASVTRSQQVYSKPNPSPALLAAEASPLGRVYMDWSPIPVITISSPADPGRTLSVDPATAQNTFVTFRDPRFMLDIPVLRSRTQPPLTAIIELDPANHVIRQSLDERVQR